MVKEWLRMWRARNWMRRNRGFLPSWHAYVGFKLGLFEQFKDGATVAEVVSRSGYDASLLDSWLDVGLNIGHLKRLASGAVRSNAAMCRDFSRQSESAIGELLVEMMELHIPSLLAYPHLMNGGARRTFDGQQFATTVASTSAMIEEAAFPVLQKWMKRWQSHAVLDIGCGYAGYLLRLARQNRSLILYGIEKERELLEKAKQAIASERADSIHLLEGDFLGAGVRALGDHQQRFDLVMMNNILYYFAPEHRATLMQRAVEFLQPGGTMAMISPIRTEQAGTSGPFSAAFNSFMRAHENLFDLPSIAEMKALGQQSGLELTTSQVIIREGNWYFCGFRKV